MNCLEIMVANLTCFPYFLLSYSEVRRLTAMLLMCFLRQFLQLGTMVTSRPALTANAFALNKLEMLLSCHQSLGCMAVLIAFFSVFIENTMV